MSPARRACAGVHKPATATMVKCPIPGKRGRCAWHVSGGRRYKTAFVVGHRRTRCAVREMRARARTRRCSSTQASRSGLWFTDTRSTNRGVAGRWRLQADMVVRPARPLQWWLGRCAKKGQVMLQQQVMSVCGGGRWQCEGGAPRRPFTRV